MVREVEKPKRAGLDGLLHQARHRGDVVRGGGLVAGAALAHRVGADRAVRHLAADVDGELLLADDVEVLGVAFPAPGDALGERGAGNVLDAFHQADQPVFATGPHRREADAAVAGHDGGHAVPAGRLEQGVPADLAVVVGVDVDKAGRDDLSGGVDGLGGIAFQRRTAGCATPDLDDLAVFDGDVGIESVCAGAVHDGAAGDFEIEHDYSLVCAADWLQ